MDIDLRSVPFSRNGAYLAFSILPRAGDSPAGLYLRSLHGGAQAASPGGRVALVEPVLDGQPVPYQVMATPARLELLTVQGTVSICMPEPWVIRVRSESLGMRLTFNARQGEYVIPLSDGCCQVNSPGFQLQFMLSPLCGSWWVDAPWTGAGATRVVIELQPTQDEPFCEAAIEEFENVWKPRTYEGTFEVCVAEVEADFKDWWEHTPRLPAGFSNARRLAAYINWSSMVEPHGHFLRPAMFMSKNWMTNVWSWDHCFNAMALTYHRPAVAWDQIMLIFDQQDEYGGLPDYVNDRGMLWNFCKPPIHGWVLGWMMRHTSFIRQDQVRQVYGQLCRWTEWWFRFRDDDHDGIPQYHHGNDSGWDNATPFQVGVPLESPDLCAYLALQMETLAMMAVQLGNMEEAESWQRRSEELLEMMLAHFWQGDHFVAMRSGDHLIADTESLLLYLPLILGKRLPQAVREELVAGLTRPGRFLTPYGLATESPGSGDYEADGYWRGPIWAPATMILVEGLADCGEMDLARDIARRFCDMAARHGMAENYNALTGEPLRDRAYTWTASVFLVLAHEYLLEK
jgi:glycogen debranching enzyme